MVSIAFTIFNLAISVIGVILNGALIILLIKRPALRSNSTNKFLLNLMITGFGITINTMVMEILHVSKKYEHSYHIPHMVSVLISSIAFEMSLLLVTIDRFIAVQLPLRYRDILSTGMVYLLTSMIWLISLIATIIGIATVSTHRHTPVIKLMSILITVFIALSLVSMFVLTAVNLAVFRQVKRQIDFLISVTVPTEENANSREKLKKQEIKSAYLCFAMVFSFIICWLPAVIKGFHIVADKNVKVSDHDLHLSLSALFIALDMVINIFLYVLLKEEIKLAIRKLFRSSRWGCCQRIAHIRESISNRDPSRRTVKKNCQN